jgi:hypothetical protein
MSMAKNWCYLQRIGKNEEAKKPVISSVPVSGAELHVSAIYLQ